LSKEQQIETGKEVRALKSKFLDKFFETKEQVLWEAFQEARPEDLNQIHLTLKALQALKLEVQNALDSQRLSETPN